MKPIYLLNESHQFPPADEADAYGLLAMGGDLHHGRLLQAYANGIFPWYSDNQPILWWSPDPRMVLYPEDFKLSKSLRQTLRNRPFEVSFDSCFEAVIQACQSARREGQEGTWITDELIEAFVHLHRLGYAHSVEVFLDGKLAGGLYGLSLGAAFFGESMFHNRRDASKVALFYLVEWAKKHTFDLIDAQQQTTHMERLGAKAMARPEFLERLAMSLTKPAMKGNWKARGAKLIEEVHSENNIKHGS